MARAAQPVRKAAASHVVERMAKAVGRVVEAHVASRAGTAAQAGMAAAAETMVVETVVWEMVAEMAGEEMAETVAGPLEAGSAGSAG